jgi:hypothetical protein
MHKPGVEVKVRLSEEISDKLARRALSRGVSVGAIIREALGEFLDQVPRKSNLEPAQTNTSLGEIKSILANAVNLSTNWADLRKHLAENDLELAPKGGGLVVRSTSSDSELCKASEVGFAYSKLIERFGEGLPGHHEWLAERVLAKKAKSP